MISCAVRFIKRFLILVPGIIVAYFASTRLYPYLHKEVPTVLAVFLTYLVSAYLLVPAFIRLIRIVIKPKHIPLYSTTPDGLACDPINIGIVGTYKEVIDAMEQAGWHIADKKTPKSLVRFMMSVFFGKEYKNAPFSNLYLFGRSQDFGMQMHKGSSTNRRHHVRFWAASHTSDPRHLEHISFWENYHKSDLLKERILWVGAASLDVGLGVIKHNAQITHMIDPDTDAERELIVSGLKSTNLAKKSRKVKIGEPYKLTNRVLTGYLHSDGMMSICELS